MVIPTMHKETKISYKVIPMGWREMWILLKEIRTLLLVIKTPLKESKINFLETKMLVKVI